MHCVDCCGGNEMGGADTERGHDQQIHRTFCKHIQNISSNR